MIFRRLQQAHRQAALGGLALLCGMLSGSCQHAASPSTARPEQAAALHQGYAMGTRIHLTVVSSDACLGAAAARAALSEAARLDRLLTTFEHPGWEPSDVMRLNAAAGAAYVSLSPETLEVLQLAQHISACSDGAFDISFAALSRLWHFDEDFAPHVPAAALIEGQRAHVDYRKIRLRAVPPGACLQDAQMQISLGGIAKGYAVDRMAQVLRAHGCQHFLVQAGGDLYASGRNGARPWEVDVRDPRAAAPAAVARVHVQNAAFSTSGDYERAFEARAVRYHHILDPRTGYPARACQSVSVMAPTAALADALGDAIFIVGPKRGLDLAAQFKHTAALIVDAQGTLHQSPHLAASGRQ